MIKRASIIFLACTYISCVSAHGDDRSSFYAKIEGGASFPTHQLNKKFYNNAKTPNSTFLGAGVGYIVNDHIRSDITLTFRPTSNLRHSSRSIVSGLDHTEEINQDFSHTTLMLNTYYNFYKFGSFSPYLSAGVGVSRSHLGNFWSRDIPSGDPDHIVRSSDKTTKFSPAWTIGLGTNLGISKDFDLDIFYRYVNLGKAKKSIITETFSSTTNTYTNNPGKLSSHETGLGLTVRF